MTRFEDLPPVDGEGWLADQGRNFLQSTDQRISRLRLPNFLAESTRKIQGLGSDLGQMYQGLEQGLSSLPSQAQQGLHQLPHVHHRAHLRAGEPAGGARSVRGPGRKLPGAPGSGAARTT